MRTFLNSNRNNFFDQENKGIKNPKKDKEEYGLDNLVEKIKADISKESPKYEIQH